MVVPTDEDLSEDDDRIRQARTKRPIVIPESEEESVFEAEDDIPLFQIAGPSSRTARTKKPRWRDGFLEKADSDLVFSGNVSMSPEIMKLETPIQFYKYLFTDEMFHYISEQTRLYAAEKRPEKIPNITAKDIEQFVGVCFMVSITQLPSTRDYWNETLGYPKINTIMSCNRFEKLKRFIHFNTNSTQIAKGQPGYDPLHKLRPFLVKIKERLLMVPKEKYMAVDEQIIPTKSRSTIKQYNPKKKP